MTSTPSDADLVSTYLSGDRTALAAIYDRYSSGLYDTAAAMLSDRHDAADMVQDVFCIAAERLDQLRDPSRLKPWLYAVLRNEVYRRTKRRRRATPTDFQSDTVPDVVAPIDPGAEGASVAFAELAALVREAAAGLDERDQLILELSVRQGLEGADLADALGVTAEQSYSLVHRMRERVDRSLGAYVVAKAGRKECDALDEILRDWDGRFSVLIRKRVARHIESCETCEETKGKVAPLALFGAAPVLAAPLGLRAKVLAATSNIAIPNGTSTGTGNAARIRWRTSDGFPRAARFTRRTLWWSTGAVVLVATGALVGATLVGSSSDDGITATGTPVTTISGGSESPDTAPDNTSDSGPDTTIDTTIDTGSPTTSAAPSSIAPTPTTPPRSSTTVVSNAITTTSTAGGVVPPTNTPTTTPATTTPATSTTTRPPSLTAFVLSTSSLDFGTTSTTMKVRLTNKNATALGWKASSARPAFFTFSPSSGTLASGASVNVTVTFARATASTYANTATFPEGPFPAVAAQVTATGAPAATLSLNGAVGRPPQVGSIAVRFSSATCSNASIQVPVTDESAIKSVIATLTLTGSIVTSTRTVTLTDSGKGSWVGVSSNIPGSVTAVSVSVRATDRNGLATTVGTKVTRPSSC
ncbi:MAG: sigma-70 family RNA polymerase sigma factor [Ilumatobacteraceae bacterium]